MTFTPHGRLYDVDPGTTAAAVGDEVLVPAEAGPELATVACVADVELAAELPVCFGPASQAHRKRETRNRHLRAEATEIAKALIAEHELPMRLVGQDLAANQLQAQGVCGRLKCCLTYEQAMYEDFQQRAPALGCRVDTEHGPGVVVSR